MGNVQAFESQSIWIFSNDLIDFNCFSECNDSWKIWTFDENDNIVPFTKPTNLLDEIVR